MSCNHDGKPLPGTVHRVTPAPPELQARILKYWGVVGSGELRGERGARPIEIHITLHNEFDSWAVLRGFLEGLDKAVGRHGTLRVIQESVPRTFPHCTFLGFTPGESPEDGPLPDVAGTLETPAGKWWITGTLRFLQLSDVK